MMMDTIYDLRCEYRIAPLGIDSPTPRFSWKTRKPQLAFRIRCGSWDSGEVDSQECRAVYDGAELEQQKAYSWQVGIRTPEGFFWSEPSTFETGFFFIDGWNAGWIPYSWTHTLPGKRTLNYLRREFVLTERPIRARLYIASTNGYSGNDTLRMNLYHPRLNGEKVGKDFLNPGQLAGGRALYRTYDILPMLRIGENAFGTATAANSISFEILLDFADGRRERFCSGPGTFRLANGGARTRLWRPEIYEFGGKGEVYDARAELTGWDLPGYHNNGWKTVSNRGYVPPALAEQTQSAKIFEELTPVSFRKTGKSTFLADFGRNMNGHERLRIRGGSCGDSVSIRFAETLDGAGNPDYTSTLSAVGMASVHEDVYTKRGDGVEVYEPEFANHGFRYMEITGAPEPFTAEDIAARTVSSEIEPRLEFRSSEPFLNALFRLAQNSFRSNLMSVCTDCPSRERQGWPADAASVSDALNLFYDMELFMEKWLRDVGDSQYPDGSLPFIVPFPEILNGPEVSWTTGFLQIVHDTWLVNGDPALLQKTFPVFRRWTHFLERIAGEDGLSRGYVLYNDHFGSQTAAPVFLENLFAYSSFQLQKEFAEILGEREETLRMTDAMERKRTALQSLKRLDGNYGNGTVAEAVLVLAYGVSDSENLWERIQERVQKDLSVPTGYLATRPLMELLTRRVPELAWELIRSSRPRTWRNWLEHGLTTAPESWEFQKGTLNHAALAGPMASWLIRGLGGLEHVQPGGTAFRLTPFIPADVPELSISLETPCGTLSWGWKTDGKRLRFLNVPCGCEVEWNGLYKAGDYLMP